LLYYNQIIQNSGNVVTSFHESTFGKVPTAISHPGSRSSNMTQETNFQNTSVISTAENVKIIGNLQGAVGHDQITGNLVKATYYYDPGNMETVEDPGSIATTCAQQDTAVWFNHHECEICRGFFINITEHKQSKHFNIGENTIFDDSDVHHQKGESEQKQLAPSLKENTIKSINRQYACDLCSASYTTQSSLIRHQKGKHLKDKEITIVCDSKVEHKERQSCLNEKEDESISKTRDTLRTGAIAMK
jgi:hypothetical protein